MARRGDSMRRGDPELDEIKEDLLVRGLISVPTKPTPAMIIAGVTVSGLSPERILRIYQALLEASDWEGRPPTPDLGDPASGS